MILNVDRYTSAGQRERIAQADGYLKLVTLLLRFLTWPTLREAVREMFENGVENCHLSAYGKLMAPGQPDRAVRSRYVPKGAGRWGQWE